MDTLALRQRGQETVFVREPPLMVTYLMKHAKQKTCPHVVVCATTGVCKHIGQFSACSLLMAYTQATSSQSSILSGELKYERLSMASDTRKRYEACMKRSFEYDTCLGAERALPRCECWDPLGC